MKIITSKHLVKYLSLLGMISLSSCSMFESTSANLSPAAPMYSAASSDMLNENSTSSKTRQVTKKASLNIDVSNVKDAGKQVETIVSENRGQITSMERRDDDSQYASYEIRVPSQKLVSTLDAISALGKVTYRKIKVEDTTRKAIQQQARYQQLLKRKQRLLKLYHNAHTIKDKLELEKQLSEVEEALFQIQAAIRQGRKFADFSKISLELSRRSIRGPIGLVMDSFQWGISKLFTIREN